jgi:hypothetical protein
MTQEGLQALRAFRGRLNDRLLEIPEYRALAVIDRTIGEISAIFGSSPPDAETAAATPGKSVATPGPRAITETAQVSDLSQTRIALAIADTIETNISQIRSPRTPAAAYASAGAAL